MDTTPQQSTVAPVKVRATRYVSFYLGIVLFLAAFGIGVVVGNVFFHQSSSVPGSTSGLQGVLSSLNTSASPPSNVDFSQFWQVWNTIHARYYATATDTDLMYGSIEGMVAGLDDPYSVFFPPAEATQFNNDLSGQLSGIGAEVGMKQNQLVVIAPLDNTPAKLAGLMAGDRIVAIDGTSTQGMDVDTAVNLIRGPASSTVKLSILRGSSTTPKDFSIRRATISVPSVNFSMKPGNIAYIQITQFGDDTASLFQKYAAEAQADHAKGYILDLRDDPGGYLTAAVDIASDWVPTGTIVSEHFNDGTHQDSDTDGDHPLVGAKTVVLVNGGTASAAEILSGALQDHKAATIIGEQTFGKGVVQDLIPYSDGSALKLTIAAWFTPNGHSINKMGITPDITVKEDFNSEKIGQDVMVDKAMQILTSK